MFQKIEMPYAKKTVDISIEKKDLQGILRPRTDEFDPKMSQEEIVIKSLENPIGTKKLSELAIGKKKLYLLPVITQDHSLVELLSH